jgi:mannose-6-phosphate isomerase-like protein (cupin superfamily)
MVPDRHMDPYFAEFIPLEKGMEPRPHMHAGFEFLYVLDGELALKHGEHESVLEAGDAVYFDASTPHSYQSAGRKAAQAIIVTMHQAPAGQPQPLRAAGIPRPAAEGPARASGNDGGHENAPLRSEQPKQSAAQRSSGQNL